MKYYAVIDTNVIISALLKWDSVPGKVLRLVFEGEIVPVLEKKIVQEYANVLARPKFGFPEEIIADILSSLIMGGVFVDPDELDIEMPDFDDKKFYEAVIEKRKEEDAYLITGNIKHFPKDSFIVTPRQMLNILFYSAVLPNSGSLLRRFFNRRNKLTLRDILIPNLAFLCLPSRTEYARSRVGAIKRTGCCSRCLTIGDMYH